jgi:hypothetical protein
MLAGARDLKRHTWMTAGKRTDHIRYFDESPTFSKNNIPDLVLNLPDALPLQHLGELVQRALLHPLHDAGLRRNWVL